MKKKLNEDSQRMLVLLKLDAKRLFERVKFRAPEYLSEFSLKRTRDHFKEIFNNRYDQTTIKELILCGQEVIVGLDQFYSLIDTMRWYLNHTQDMPNRVDDKIHKYISELEVYYETLNLYIDVELGLIKEEQPLLEENEQPIETTFNIQTEILEIPADLKVETNENDL
jgi:hypothetical protein